MENEDNKSSTGCVILFIILLIVVCYTILGDGKITIPIEFEVSIATETHE